MNSLQFPGLALGGGTLVGHKLVKFVYLDEAGTSPDSEHLVVAGVIVDGDRDVPELEGHIRKLVERHIPESDRRRFHFHMKDIWNGKKLFEDREKWPHGKRMSIIRDLADVPRLFGLPVVQAAISRERFTKAHPEYQGKHFEETIHCATVGFCLLSAERYLRDHFDDEVAQVIAEHHPTAMRKIDETVDELMDPYSPLREEFESQLTPFQKLKNGIHFATKNRSDLLQLADMCAFFIRGKLNRRADIDDYFMRLYPNLFTIQTGRFLRDYRVEPS